MSEKQKKQQKKSGLGLAIWILAFLIILIVFLVKADDIKNNLNETRFFERLFGKTPSFMVEESKTSQNPENNSETIINLKKSDKKTEIKQETVTTESKKDEKVIKTEEKKPAVPVVEEKTKTEISDPKKIENPVQTKSENQKSVVKEENKTTPVAAEKKIEVKKTETVSAKPDTIASKIFFVSIDSDGPIIRKEVTRNVAKDSPLTNSIKAMLEGPSSSERNKGCTTLIPEGTKLYSASVKNGIAVLNFSEEFEFNQYGVEGYLGQLMQIVYTATNYSSVKSVQIMIEGKKKEYLGSEGVWIGSPLSRASFK